MNPKREENLFQLALSKPAAKRAAWLDGECKGDAALRARLEALLAAHEQPEALGAIPADPSRLRENAPAGPARPKLDLADAPGESAGQTLRRLYA